MVRGKKFLKGKKKEKASLHSPGKGHSMNNAENGRMRNILRGKKKKKEIAL